MRKTITLMTALAIVLSMCNWAYGVPGITQTPGGTHAQWYWDGTGNIIDVEQHSTLPDNWVEIGQDGDDNYVELRQTATVLDNYGLFCQYGDNLTANVDQEGQDNDATVYQRGRNSTVTVSGFCRKCHQTRY